MCKVLKNGVEVKLQRNALSVLEHPTGNEDDLDYDNSSSGSEIHEKDNDFCKLPYILSDDLFVISYQESDSNFTAWAVPLLKLTLFPWSSY